MSVTQGAMPSLRGTRRRTRAMVWLLRLWLSVVLLFIFSPLIAVAVLSFNESPYGTLPFSFTLEWYLLLFEQRELLVSTLWDLELSVAVGVTAAIMGTLLALWMKRVSKGAALPLHIGLISAMTIPWLLLGVGMLLVLRQIGLGRSIVSMYLGCLAVSLPYVVFIVRARLDSLDPAIQQAGLSLGASHWQVFMRITVPLIGSAAMAGGFMAFVTCFNNFVIQYFLAPIGFRTLPLEIYTMVKMGYKPDINALGTILVAIAAILVLILQKLSGNAGKLLMAK
jgi:ABC-type spermidine/putrescine transport system permease subunit II